MLLFKAESKGLKLNLEIAEDVPKFVKSDDGKLRQILINLLGNAIKFTEKGSVTLQVINRGDRPSDSEKELAIEDNKKLKLHFAVSDTGLGIAPEEMDKLFEPFEQTATGRKSKQGTGLGLPIGRKFVQLMGGDISVSSEVERGSKFAFDIEVCAVDSSSIQMFKSQRMAIGLAPGQPEYRILVVDDVKDNRLVATKLLSSVGFQVREAANGEEAIAVWLEWQPQLIWMDMQMPVMNGYEATRQIKAHPLGKNLAIVALTASAFEEEKTAILAAGCDDFVRKPFQANVLFVKMGELLGVRYIYDDEVASISDKKVKETGISSWEALAAELGQMPIEWVALLHQAATECHDEEVLRLIEKMPVETPTLAQALSDAANNFLFDDIIELTKSVHRSPV